MVCRISSICTIILFLITISYADPALELHCANANNNTEVQLWFSEPVEPISAGVYYAVLQAGELMETRRLIMVK
ncbi:hypothetical protein ISS30_02750 [bacterium]|nr:hypothetical protein [FCB group bacterium]MBL7190589.1 hypothetical protein [bacterium]